MRSILLLLTALVAGVLGTVTAIAQTTTPPAVTLGTDTHGGRHRGSLLMTADGNHDGVITRAEMLAAADARAARMSANAAGTDADGGRKLRTPEAMHARAAAMFDRADTNRDGKLDSAEIAARRGMMKRAGAAPPDASE